MATTQQLTWVTNIPTPYRVPLWRELASSVELKLVFMAATEPNRDWDGHSMSAEVRGTVLDAPRLSIGPELALYMPTVRLHRAVAGARAVLIDGWESPAYVYLAILCKVRRVPLVYFYRSNPGSQRDSLVIRVVRNFLFSRAEAVLTGGPSSSEAVRAMKVPESRIIEGVNTVDLDAFTSVPRGTEAPRRHRFVYVGQLIPRKNVNELVAAMARISGHASLTIVGDGPERDSVEAAARSAGVADRVVFAGQVTPSEVAEMLANCDTLVLPSLTEVYGLVVPEALAAGLHCVVSTGTGVLPSVRGMRGVFPADPTAAGLAAAMTQSAADWNGPIEAPEILSHTTSRMVDAVQRAVSVANSRLTR